MSRRPIVHQFTAVLAGRDAVGQHTLAVDDLLRDMGAETEIFAAHVHPEVRERGHDFREHETVPAPDLILYQTSIGSPVGDYVMSRPERLVLNYHNMTPAEFFDPWEPAVAAELDHGRRQLARLARRADHAIAVSEYNADELLALGMAPASVSVSPVLFVPLWESGNALRGRVSDTGVAPSPGRASMLFVGRLAPNKCQQDLVGVLAGVVALGVDARLVLVGGASSAGFVDAVVALAEGLGVADRLVVAGSVSEAELVGFYESADVFVSVSEHEGFCVPVVEALGFGVPVVAFGAAAVPETLGGAGLVVGGGGAEKSVGVVAEAVVRVLSDPVVREGLVSRGRVRAEELGLSASTARMPRHPPTTARRIAAARGGVVRPLLVDLVLPEMHERDATSTHTRLLRDILVADGHRVRFVVERPTSTSETVVLLDRWKADGDLTILQHSIGSLAASEIARRELPVVVNYHNITPPHFVEPWEPEQTHGLRWGREQLWELRPLAHAAMADSDYNARELREVGYRSVSVSPVLFVPLWESGNALRGRVSDTGVAPSPGRASMLFVGRLAPNKCQQDLVGVLAGVVALGVDARLVLVGGASSAGFVDAVVALAEGLGVADRLVVAGSVSEAELVGFYESADVFVSVSEHEGFCVPVVEALGFGVPVVAFGAAAVPETLGGAGLVVGGGGAEKSVGVVAEAVVRVLSDPVVREGLVSRGRVRAEELGLSASTARMPRHPPTTPGGCQVTVPVTFVTPRYGAEVLGGAEAGARLLATRLAADGRDVTVITSCATSMQTWADDFAAGETLEDGVRVVRCRVDHERAPDFDALSDRVLPRAPQVSEIEALDWIDKQGPTSSALLEAVEAVDRGVLVFYPYLYHPTVRGIPLAGVPSILYPAAHRELPFELPIFREVFTEVDGIAVHTRAEQSLVHRRFPGTVTMPQALVGLPVESSGAADPAAARATLGFGEEKIALSLGRVDRGKGTHDLVERFARFRAGGGRGRLVLAGPVAEAPPPVDGVTLLGPISHDDKSSLMAAADVFINPSFYESFSLVILEAWLAGTPVLVNGWCAPLVEHVRNSGGGLYYTGVADFEIALGRLFAEPETAAALAAAGGEYVRRSYSWRAVSRRLDGLIDRVS